MSELIRNLLNFISFGNSTQITQVQAKEWRLYNVQSEGCDSRLREVITKMTFRRISVA